ncbi:hypothetical protein MNB_SUP05-5-75 [hydrothermal vent metagenome]|uniref:Pyridoxamine 5'-phosphate oxidase N-terminal domain-containing protein n=1 Tax=hydrothermal vent metagenome TaxID=652676 RepID=A0A1W1CAH8_9ZZZZ
MATKYTEISNKIKEFILEQKIFFVATAIDNGRVNLSPKGMDSFKVLDKNRIIWLNMTGSGNETSAHIQKNSRMTMMWTAFEGNPIILRLYGNAKVIHPTDDNWQKLYSHFKDNIGARQIFDVEIDLVLTSCGMGTPFFEYKGEREQLNDWAEKKGEQGIKDYWQEKNSIDLDGNKINF